MDQMQIRKRMNSVLAFACVLLAAPSVLWAGVNSWTGGNPSGSSIVATDPHNPLVLYAASGSGLYRSGDGGRSWIRISSFNSISSLLVHPTLPSTLYLGSSHLGLLKSEDGGVSWSQPLINVRINALAASDSSPSTLYAGTFEWLDKSSDAGNHWEQTNHLGLAQEVAALVIDPKNDATIYSGDDGQHASSDYCYCGLSGYFFAKSTDGGATFADLSARVGGPVDAIAIDPDDSSRIFVGLAYQYGGSGASSSVLRSEDAGFSWSPAGLPEFTNVVSLAMDPSNSSVLYAGTSHGVYRTRDAGANWIPIGQQLRGVTIVSLALDRSGRFLHAATHFGEFDLEMASGALDVSSGAAGQTRVLFWESDRLSVRTLGDDGAWTSTPFEGPFFGWTAVAISDGADGLSRVLWQNGDGRVSLEIAGPSGSQAAYRFPAEAGWTATDVSVGADGEAHVLWTSAAGQARIDSMSSSGLPTAGHISGPYGGWSALAIADGPDGAKWLLWRHTAGRAAISRSKAGETDVVFRWNATPGWTVEDIAVGSDGLPRLLWTSPDGRMEITTVDAHGELTVPAVYSNAGLQARRIAASPDGLTRVLWGAADGTGELWLFNPDNSLNSRHETPTPIQSVDLTGTWTGRTTYFPVPSPIRVPCPASEPITVSVAEHAGGQITAKFSSSCYGNASFAGQASMYVLSGQLLIQQHICDSENGYTAWGYSSGSFDASHIHLETPDPGTTDCSFAGSVIDIHR